MKHQRYYSLFALAAAILWGTTGTSQKLAATTASPYSLGAIRLLIGAFALLVMSGVRRTPPRLGLFKRRETYLSAVFIAAYQLTFFAGVLKTGVATGTMVAIGSAPIFAGLYSYLRYRENPGRTWLFATTISIMGCILLIAGGGNLRANGGGILLTLIAGFSYAMYIANSKHLLKDDAPETVTSGIFLVAALLLVPVLLTQDLSWLLTWRGAAVAMHLGVFTTAVAFLLFSIGLSRISFPAAVTLSLAEPITASLLGVFLLGEKLTAVSTMGLAMVFIGLVILSSARTQTKPISEPLSKQKVE